MREEDIDYTHTKNSGSVEELVVSDIMNGNRVLFVILTGDYGINDTRCRFNLELDEAELAKILYRWARRIERGAISRSRTIQ